LEIMRRGKEEGVLNKINISAGDFGERAKSPGLDAHNVSDRIYANFPNLTQVRVNHYIGIEEPRDGKEKVDILRIFENGIPIDVLFMFEHGQPKLTETVKGHGSARILRIRAYLEKGRDGKKIVEELENALETTAGGVALEYMRFCGLLNADENAKINGTIFNRKIWDSGFKVETDKGRSFVAFDFISGCGGGTDIEHITPYERGTESKWNGIKASLRHSTRKVPVLRSVFRKKAEFPYALLNSSQKILPLYFKDGYYRYLVVEAEKLEEIKVLPRELQ